MTREITSASNIFRRELCPASERMEAGLPEENSEQAEEGRILHLHAADKTLDRSKLPRAQRDLLEINDRIVREIFERVAARFGDELATDHGADNITWWLHRGIRFLFPGHPDLFEYRPSKLLVVVDYKFGFKEVSHADANLQLRSYAVMGAENFDCDNVCVAITQPRLSRDQQLTMAIYGRDEIAASRQQLYQIWDGAKDPDAPLNPSEESCRYCKAKMICDAYKSKFLAISEGINRSTVATAQHSLAQLSDDQLERVLVAIQFAGFIEKHAKDVARERISAGGMPGWKLGRESEVREVTDVPAAMALLTAAGVSADALRPALKMKIGDVEDAYRDAHDKMTWKDAKDQVNEILGDLIERHKKAPSVERVK